jgi:hypothetical protein
LASEQSVRSESAEPVITDQRLISKKDLPNAQILDQLPPRLLSKERTLEEGEEWLTECIHRFADARMVEYNPDPEFEKPSDLARHYI